LAKNTSTKIAILCHARVRQGQNITGWNPGDINHLSI